jgi:hypothetical protein
MKSAGTADHFAEMTHDFFPIKKARFLLSVFAPGNDPD